MVMLTVLEKIYGDEESALRSFQNHLQSVSSGLEVDVKILGRTGRGWIQIEVAGADAPVLVNYLRKKSGFSPNTFEGIHIPLEIKGRIVDSGKVGFGLYVDIGVSSPQVVDVLIPLHVLRRQLVNDEKLSTRRIIDAFCLHDNFPIKVKLTQIDMNKLEVRGELSEDQLATLDNWISLGFDKVIALGVTLDRIKYILKKSNSIRDIIRVDQLGFLEYSLLCKLGTEAPGIISKVGSLLEGIPLYAFSPKKIRKLVNLMN